MYCRPGAVCQPPWLVGTGNGVRRQGQEAHKGNIRAQTRLAGVSVDIGTAASVRSAARRAYGVHQWRRHTGTFDLCELHADSLGSGPRHVYEKRQKTDMV